MPATLANHQPRMMDDATRDSLKSVARLNAAPEARLSAGRTSRAGNWNAALNSSDVKSLWNELHRLVCYHPLVRASWSAGLLIETDANSNRTGAHTDLTQELFVTLLSKERFQHYLDTAMTDAEIECEIGQLELTNLLTAELRKRHPESYRLARRISTVVQTSPNFRRFDTLGGVEEDEADLEATIILDGGDDEAETAPAATAPASTHRRLADRVYGLREWHAAKPRRGMQEMEQRIQLIPMRQRDTRLVGCTGDSQIIISNPELEQLIISVLEAVDAPADMRALRSLVMSRLPVMDIYLVPLGGDDSDDDSKPVFEPVAVGDNPEESLLRFEREQEAIKRVDGFLQALHKDVRGKAKQYDRMIGALWYCYLNPSQMTQLEAAALLGVSDSLISDYRRRIEAALRALNFSEVEEARRFEAALRERVRQVVGDAPHTA